MKISWIKITATVLIVGAVGLASALPSVTKIPATQCKTSAATKPTKKKDPAPKPLPRFLDLGSDKCVPCKMMIPVLAQLRKEYKGKLTVEFIDVWKDQSAAKKYKVKSIPTQIFFDAKGKEVYRHVGFIPKDDVIKAFREHGVKL